MRIFLIRLIVNAVALAVAARLITGIAYGGWVDLLIVALLFGVVNALVKPVLKLLTCPLIALTLGLFVFVINALMLWLTAVLARLVGVAFIVNGFWPAFWGALIVSAVSYVLQLVLTDERS